jgi:hypothetical protein
MRILNLTYVFTLISIHVFAQNNVGIGTTAPQKSLSVFGGVNIDQENIHGPALGTNSLTFGSYSVTGIASNRTLHDLMVFTSNIERMRVANDGKISINWPENFKGYLARQIVNINHTGNYQSYSYEDKMHAFMIADNQDAPNESYDGSFLYMGTNRIQNVSYIQAERNNYGQNVGNTLLLQYRGNATVGLVAGPTEKLEVLGNVKLNPNNIPYDTERGDLTVRGGQGIIRNSTNSQLLKQIKSVTVNTPFIAGETKFFDFTWNDAYTDTPEAYVGNITAGTGGWAEVVMSVALVTATGGRLYVYNPTGPRTPNFTITILALGVKD